MTLEQSIEHYAGTAPERTALVCGEQTLSYSALWEAIVRKEEELRGEGLKAGRPYIWRSSGDCLFVVTYCAVHRLGAIAVPLEQGAPEESFLAIKRQTEAQTYAPGISDILYTTGTTGQSKGVMLSETALCSCADNFINAFGFDSGLCMIVSGPLNHIASLFKIHPTLTAGGAVCIINGLRDPNLFFEALELPFDGFAAFLVPASIHILLSFSAQRLASHSGKIRFIETGAAPISSADMAALAECLPHSDLWNTLGGTEFGAVCTYNFNDGRYMEGCIGRPMKNSTVEVDAEGSISISGPTLMSGYVADPESSAKVLKDGVLRISDRGFVDEDGLIHLTGRADDVINVGGFKIDPVEVENAAGSHPDIEDCLCVAAAHPLLGTVLKLLVVPKQGRSLDKRSIALHIKARLEPYKIPTYYEAVPSIKRTFNGKADRKAYRLGL